jgi:hypothetical protein
LKDLEFIKECLRVLELKPKFKALKDLKFIRKSVEYTLNLKTKNSRP